MFHTFGQTLIEVTVTPSIREANRSPCEVKCAVNCGFWRQTIDWPISLWQSAPPLQHMCQFAVPPHWQLRATNVSLQFVIPVPTLSTLIIDLSFRSWLNYGFHKVRPSNHNCSPRAKQKFAQSLAISPFTPLSLYQTYSPYYWTQILVFRPSSKDRKWCFR